MSCPKIKEIDKLVSKASGVSVEDIRGRNRCQEFSDARAAVWYIAHEVSHYSYPFIAKEYGRNHTSITAAVKKIRGTESEQIILSLVKNRVDLKPSGKAGLRSAERWG